MNAYTRSCLAKLLTVLMSTVSTVATLVRAEAQQSGRVAAVNNDATGTPPGLASRMLAIGTNIVHNESVQTSASGSTQILFPDSSTLNVGRNSTIVINEYVYDPNAGTGKMIASLSKGVMRFVGGEISHTAGVTINTPLSSVGIRGGVATIVYPIPAGYGASDPNLANCKGQLVIGHVGSSTIHNNTGSVTVKPGFATCITGSNDPIPAPFRIGDAVLQQVMVTLTSRPGQSGGAGGAGLPTDTMVSHQGFGTTNLTNPTHPPGTDPLGYFSIFTGGNSTAQTKAQAGQAAGAYQ